MVMAKREWKGGEVRKTSFRVGGGRLYEVTMKHVDGGEWTPNKFFDNEASASAFIIKQLRIGEAR